MMLSIQRFLHPHLYGVAKRLLPSRFGVWLAAWCINFKLDEDRRTDALIKANMEKTRQALAEAFRIPSHLLGGKDHMTRDYYEQLLASHGSTAPEGFSGATLEPTNDARDEYRRLTDSKYPYQVQQKTNVPTARNVYLVELVTPGRGPDLDHVEQCDNYPAAVSAILRHYPEASTRDGNHWTDGTTYSQIVATLRPITVGIDPGADRYYYEHLIGANFFRAGPFESYEQAKTELLRQLFANYPGSKIEDHDGDFRVPGSSYLMVVGRIRSVNAKQAAQALHRDRVDDWSPWPSYETRLKVYVWALVCLLSFIGTAALTALLQPVPPPLDRTFLIGCGVFVFGGVVICMVDSRDDAG